MKDDRVTLELKGTVPLDLFATAMSGFAGLINALTAEVAAGVKVDWVVDELSAGSAFASFAGESTDTAAVHRIVNAYETTGSALRKGEPIPYSERVRQEASKITGLLNGKVTEIRFQEIPVSTPHDGGAQSAVADETKPIVALGAVEGVVQTVTSRHALRFTLYDTVNDKAVNCFLNPAQHDMMAEYFDKRAIVQGLVTRNAVTGRPTEIRHISKVELVEGPTDYRRARGVLSSYLITDELPEVTVRRNRDAD